MSGSRMLDKFYDGVERRQAQWRAGLPYSRFGPLFVCGGPLLAFLAVSRDWFDGLVAPAIAGIGVVLFCIGVRLEAKASRKAKLARFGKPGAPKMVRRS